MIDGDTDQFVIFRLGNEEYGFDVSKVREIHDVSDVAKVHRSASHIEGVMNLRGKLLTVVNMRKRFSMPAADSKSDTSRIVVVDALDAPVGFLVDEVVEVTKLPKGTVEKAPAYVTTGIEAQYVVGIAKIDDRLITIVDPIKILELSDETGSGAGGA
jgi:purine-binding chemotaxis protein CheW